MSASKNTTRSYSVSPKRYTLSKVSPRGLRNRGPLSNRIVAPPRGPGGGWEGGWLAEGGYGAPEGVGEITLRRQVRECPQHLHVVGAKRARHNGREMFGTPSWGMGCSSVGGYNRGEGSLPVRPTGRTQLGLNNLPIKADHPNGQDYGALKRRQFQILSHAYTTNSTLPKLNCILFITNQTFVTSLILFVAPRQKNRILLHRSEFRAACLASQIGP